MKKDFLSIPGGVPENLFDLINGDQTGYSVRIVYALLLDHTLMGEYPAIIRGLPRGEDLIITTDRELILEIWKMLTPRKSKILEMTYLVNDELGIGFPYSTKKYEQKTSPATALLNRKWFDHFVSEAKKSGSTPFAWAPGLVSNDMSREEFFETIQAASDKLESKCC